MAFYAVYHPPSRTSGNPADDFRLLRDGNSVFALIAPVIFLAWHRLWLPLLLYMVIATMLGLLVSSIGHWSVLLLAVLPGIYLYLEGTDLLRARLERNGWQFSTMIESANEEEAEIRYLKSGDGVIPEKLPLMHPKIVKPVTNRSGPSPVPVGIFPE